MKNKLINSYINGNTKVSIYEDGTKVREYPSKPIFDFPESLDVKISNFCNLDLICGYCHEQSNKKGKHANLTNLINKLIELPVKGIELAIGGGNPLSHPNLEVFLMMLKEIGFISNLTVNQLHLKQYHKLLISLIEQNLIKGLGISYRKDEFNIKELSFNKYENTVIHLIAGIDNYKVINNLINLGFNKFLILGYKQFGNGIDYYSNNNNLIEKNIKEWCMYLPNYFGKCIISFDNLAIEQLNIKRFFTDKGWDKFFLGNDGSHSMYIDAVKEEFSKTSRSSERKSFNDCTLMEYFQHIKI